MKHVLFLFLALWGSRVGFAAFPDSVAGLIYYEDSVTFVRSNAAYGRLLLADGTYREIYSLRAYGGFDAAAPVDGTWSYRKLDATTAELKFSGPLGLRTLTFQTDSRGT